MQEYDSERKHETVPTTKTPLHTMIGILNGLRVLYY